MDASHSIDSRFRIFVTDAACLRAKVFEANGYMNKLKRGHSQRIPLNCFPLYKVGMWFSVFPTRKGRDRW